MKTLMEFLNSDRGYVFPAPGGSLEGRASTSNHDADSFISAVAARIKRDTGNRFEAAEFLSRQMHYVDQEKPYKEPFNGLILKRLGEWFRELAH